MKESAGVGDDRVGAATYHATIATLHSNLVTRPTGRAVRLAIERQIQRTTGPCVSILDFSDVRIIDYSCADEVVAKLLINYMTPTRPCEAYFMARGITDEQREPIEAVLEHHRLLLVAFGTGTPQLWGPAPDRLRRAWLVLQELGRAGPEEYAKHRGLEPRTAASWLRRLAALRLAVAESDHRYVSLPSLLESTG